jgi:hypothetical protein
MSVFNEDKISFIKRSSGVIPIKWRKDIQRWASILSFDRPITLYPVDQQVILVTVWKCSEEDMADNDKREGAEVIFFAPANRGNWRILYRLARQVLSFDKVAFNDVDISIPSMIIFEEVL